MSDCEYHGCRYCVRPVDCLLHETSLVLEREVGVWAAAPLMNALNDFVKQLDADATSEGNNEEVSR